MASTHGNLVLPPSRPVAEGGTEDHRSRRAIAPPIASRLSESAFASGPPKVSSPRCSPDAYAEMLEGDISVATREILGKAARTRKAGWFKSVTWMEDIARDIVGPDLADADAGFRTIVENLFTWANDAPR